MKANKFFLLGSLALIPLVLFAIFWATYKQQWFKNEPIKVGVLHSLSGTMAISETGVVDATLLAISQINQKGGILGREIQPLVIDGQSNWTVFAEEAEKLITKEKVSVIFGCWTSACRKSLKPVVEKHNALLIYPVQYEGLEKSPNILYTGASPNQQIIPAIKWVNDTLKAKRYFLVGSDYIFPRTANEIVKDQVKSLGGEIVGEEYIMLGSNEVDSIINKIKEAKPDVIINTINGDSNIAFFKSLYQQELTADKVAVISFSIAENEVHHIGTDLLKGQYAAWNYFQSIDTKENRAFVESFKQKYGEDRLTSDPLEAGYFGVYLWAQAVERAGTADPEAVINTLKLQSFNAPEGVVSVDADNMHVWKFVRIGQVKPDGQFDIVWTSDAPVQPNPFPASRSIKEWAELLSKMNKQWGGQWSKTVNTEEKRAEKP